MFTLLFLWYASMFTLECDWHFETRGPIMDVPVQECQVVLR